MEDSKVQAQPVAEVAAEAAQAGVQVNVVDPTTGATVEFTVARGASGPIPNLIRALARAQLKIKDPVKNRTAKVRSEKGNYDYNYADLASVLQCAREALAPEGIAIVQPPATVRQQGINVVQVETWIAIAPEGQEREERMGVELTIGIGDNKPQTMGSAITYLRRYGLQSLIGITAEEDDDANLAEGNDAETAPRQGSRGKAPQASQAARQRTPAPEAAAPSGGSQAPASEAPAGPPPAATHHDAAPAGQGGGKGTRRARPITEPQRRRLFAIMADRAEKLGMADPAPFRQAVKERLKTQYGIDPPDGQSAASLILETFYDELVSWVENYTPGEGYEPPAGAPEGEGQ